MTTVPPATLLRRGVTHQIPEGAKERSHGRSERGVQPQVASFPATPPSDRDPDLPGADWASCTSNACRKTRLEASTSHGLRMANAFSLPDSLSISSSVCVCYVLYLWCDDAAELGYSSRMRNHPGGGVRVFMHALVATWGQEPAGLAGSYTTWLGKQ